MIKTVTDSNHTAIHYLGPDLERGALPAFFYFALSGEESLSLHPYSQPATAVACEKVRVFSFTIPGHEEGLNKHNAMQYWADQMEAGSYLLEDFFEKVTHAIEWLIAQNGVDAHKMATGGLSRGGFVATHVAARLPSIQTVLGFAPLTDLLQLKEFHDKTLLQRRSAELDLKQVVEPLSHVKHLRFYIGNLDTRVGTEACFRFIRLLAERGHVKRVRHQKIELMITQSIGHNGHGTDPLIFEQGSHWVKNILLGSQE